MSLNHCKRAKIVRLEWLGFRGRARIIAKEQKIVRFEWVGFRGRARIIAKEPKNCKI